jgi:hypothetical protein
MTVSPEERFHQRQPRYSKEEFARRGNEIYESQIRSQVAADNEGKIVAIDIETGAYEVADNIVNATERLFDRYPDAQPWVIRIGHRAVFRFGSLCYLHHHLKSRSHIRILSVSFMLVRATVYTFVRTFRSKPFWCCQILRFGRAILK